jgi:hypothetical protein
VLQGSADPRTDEKDPDHSDDNGSEGLQEERVRQGDRDHGGGEAADGDEERVEREVVQLDAEEHDSGDDPRDGHVDTFFRFQPRPPPACATLALVAEWVVEEVGRFT